ncbi:hypothetical protein CBS101457_005684 [Exobasidium rhododendri]|nr:hypothetical protein CBS101457_005684 [Exobasidium rhododendri]
MALAALTKAHEEKIRLVQEERQRAWKEKRQEVELFPNLQGNPNAGGASSSVNNSAGSGRVQEYNHFYERRRAMDIAMGRRSDDDGQRKARVLRLESKGSKAKGGSKKTKKDKSKDGKETGKPKAAQIVPEVKSVEEAEEEEGEEELGGIEMVEGDYYDDAVGGGEGDGPMADPDDDGFARHATSFPPEALPPVPGTLGWWEPVSAYPPLRYIAKLSRTRNQVDEEEEENDEQQRKNLSRHVPGAAVKEEIGHDSAISKDTKASKKKGSVL